MYIWHLQSCSGYRASISYTVHLLDHRLIIVRELESRIATTRAGSQAIRTTPWKASLQSSIPAIELLHLLGTDNLSEVRGNIEQLDSGGWRTVDCTVDCELWLWTVLEFISPDLDCVCPDAQMSRCPDASVPSQHGSGVLTVGN